ncbi:Fructose-bisphosphate aldolase, class-I [mine drainage metagenome]|uniref:fructose-bisphosphate aldolase n=1 Tax=mine drainage metagenome TaxID=410659 RepID=T1AHZ8_9ZZZZ
MSIEQLEDIAQAMVAPGKGIIAIDESNSTIKKRFDAVGIADSEDNRRAYRELLLTHRVSPITFPARFCMTKPSVSPRAPASPSPRSCARRASCRASRWIWGRSRWPVSPARW